MKSTSSKLFLIFSLCGCCYLFVRTKRTNILKSTELETGTDSRLADDSDDIKTHHENKYGYYPPVQQVNYQSPLWASQNNEEPWNVYGPMCGIWYGVACRTRADEAHPGGAVLRKSKASNSAFPASKPIYSKSTGRILPGQANWTDLIKFREAFNYPGKWRGQEYLDSIRDWEKKLFEYSDMVTRIPGMTVGVRKLYNKGRRNYYDAYRKWYSEYLNAQQGHPAKT